MRPASLIILFSLLIITGCASVRVVEPGTGLSADYQRAVSRAIESGLDPAELGVEGESVSLEVTSLVDGRYIDGIEGYIRSAFEEALVTGGGALTDDGEVRLRVVVAAVGDTKTDRNLQLTFRGIRLPFYYSGGTRALFDIVVYIEDASGGDGVVADRVVEMKSGVKVHETYIMRVFGPYEFGL